jgi:hypothetical protein
MAEESAPNESDDPMSDLSLVIAQTDYPPISPPSFPASYASPLLRLPMELREKILTHLLIDKPTLRFFPFDSLSTCLWTYPLGLPPPIPQSRFMAYRAEAQRLESRRPHPAPERNTAQQMYENIIWIYGLPVWMLTNRQWLTEAMTVLSDTHAVRSGYSTLYRGVTSTYKNELLLHWMKHVAVAADLQLGRLDVGLSDTMFLRDILPRRNLRTVMALHLELDFVWDPWDTSSPRLSDTVLDDVVGRFRHVRILVRSHERKWWLHRAGQYIQLVPKRYLDSDSDSLSINFERSRGDVHDATKEWAKELVGARDQPLVEVEDEIETKCLGRPCMERVFKVKRLA